AAQGDTAMTKLSRRHFLRSAAGSAAAALALPGLPLFAEEQPPFSLPKLPYAYDALEPHIDKLTMEIHHDKHHATYVTNLNAALKDSPDVAKKGIVAILKDIKSVPEKVRQAVINNGGGHANHTMFWEIMGPKAGGEPSGLLAKAIDGAFGSF